MHLCSAIILLNFFKIIFSTETPMIFEPKIVYVDGINPWDNCRPGLKRSLSALTGLLISHHAYGSEPYNGSRNCFLTVAVPIGYRLRLKALDFDVQGRWKNCEREDTLHIFDHDRPVEVAELSSEQALPAGGSPGRILGEFCGQIPNNEKKNKKFFLFAESSHNALTLWWHTETRQQQQQQQQRHTNHPNGQLDKSIRREDSDGDDGDGRRTSSSPTALARRPIGAAEGFRLLWSSFRHAVKCRRQQNNNNSTAADRDGQQQLAEFTCETKRRKSSLPTPSGTVEEEECIPAQLACNSYADCADDEADLHPRRQLAHGCQHIPNDFIGLLTTSSGPKKLLLCAVLVILSLSICLGCCCCFMHYRNKTRTKKRVNNSRQPNEKERGPMLKQPQQQQPINDDFYHQIHQLPSVPVPPPPPVPICNFSPPPQLPTQRPPPMAPQINSQPYPTKLPQQLHHSRHLKHRHHHQMLGPSSGSGGGSSSSSSAQRQRGEQQQMPNKMGNGAVNPTSSTTTATTATTTTPNNDDSGEYFYVQQQQHLVFDTQHEAQQKQQQQHRQH